MEQLFLPRYTLGERALDELETMVRPYGNRLALIHGEKAYKACRHLLDEAVKGFEITANLDYGKEASWPVIDALLADEGVRKADVLIGAGGGKCLDVVKVVGHKLHKPVFTVATIASTCAAVTKISIIHNPDGSFREIVKLEQPPVHCFIISGVIAASPEKYFWAGMGDAMAKHVECCFSAKNDELDFLSEYGRTISSLCYEPMLKQGREAFEDVKKQKLSSEVEQIISAIIVATGSVSLAVHPNYNGAVAHALYYGMTVRPWMEQKHLHGEIVSYGTLVNLAMDKQYDELKRVYDFNVSIGLPTKLKDLGLDREDPLDDILSATVVNQELTHVPYPITKELVREAIDYLEDYYG